MKRKLEEILIEAILQKDDRKVIASLYKNAYPSIERTLRSQGASSDDIQDAFQDAMMVLVRKVRGGSFDASQSVNSFLFIITRNLWINKVKRDSRSESISESHYDDQWDDEVQYQASISDNEQTIRTVFEMLGEKCTKVFNAILFQGQKYKEIADELGFAGEGVVKIIKSRCKKKLITLLQKETELRDLLIEHDQRFTKYLS